MAFHRTPTLLTATLAAGLLACAGLAGCTSTQSAPTAAQAAGEAGSRSFASPRQAVDEIRAMVRAERWGDLAAFYDLRGSGLDRRSLADGSFFVNPGGSREPGPGRTPRIRHPFSPEFRLSRILATDDAEVVVLEMTVEIDQGAGAPVQRGLDYFRMRRIDAGWQVLPGRPTPAE
ncbi:MAG: hypothetical protein JNJ48_01410, partial [Phycisphaerae bacterium]|nr:hypothetical protein [Phycisphaerae bacterium]